MEPIDARSDSRSRRIQARTADVYAALSDPDRFARWWGPAGFRSTMHEFQFEPGGKLMLTLHGPDGVDYPSENRFVKLVPDRLVEIEHWTWHHFILTIELQAEGESTVVTWRQTFDTAEHYQEVRDVVARANQENLERLAAEVERARAGCS